MGEDREDARLTFRRWGSRIKAKLASSLSSVSLSEAKLRGGLLLGDEILVTEALHTRRRCQQQNPADISKGYQDDTLNGFETFALDYLLQGVYSHSLDSMLSKRRARNSVARRSELLKRLWKDPVYSQVLQQQLESVIFSILPAEDPQETQLQLMVPSSLHRVATLGCAEILNALIEASHWHPWRVLAGYDSPERDDVCMPSTDLRRCRDYCVRFGYSGFVVVAGYAYFRRAVTNSLETRMCAELHLAPGPDALSARSTAAFLLGQTMEGKTALDLALSQGNVALVRALGRMGCDICDISHGQITEEKKVLDRILYGGLPHWFVRTVGTLAHSGSRSVEEDGIVLENPEDIRNYTQKEVEQVRYGTGLSAPVATLLLRHYGQPSVAIERFRSDPKTALAAAQIRTAESGMQRMRSGPCGICFDESRGEMQKLLPCGGQHPFCDDCLRQYLHGVLESGNATAMICPEPTCRLPLDEHAVEEILGKTARAKFVRLAAARDVDALGHIAWCPEPGCGKAVARDQNAGLTVRCACGYRFCCSCKLPGGHDPCSCEQWGAWREAHPQLEQRHKERRKHQDRNEVWINRNAQHCPGCQGVVQRNGGCNHMVCRCGVHFCYVCGRRWEEHEMQRGGMNYYQCRLPKGQQRRSQTADLEDFQQDPLAQFEALERNEASAWRWVDEATGLVEAYHHVVPYSEKSSSSRAQEPRVSQVLREAVEVLVNAQRTMRCCCVFRWHALMQHRETGPLEFWLGEFESACSTLQAALGPTFQAAWHSQKLAAPKENRWILLESPSGDLHEVLWRLEALNLSLDDLIRLNDSVRSLEARLLSGARSGRFYGEAPGLLGRLGHKFLSWLGW